jgi:single-stranded-DNA-specific exonuclease
MSEETGFCRKDEISVREKWILETKKADFNRMADELGVHPIVVRCMVNRGLQTVEEMKKYLHGTKADLYDSFLMKDMNVAVQLIRNAGNHGEKIAIASDFDCDGIFSGYILWTAFQKIGLDARIYTPDRIQEGYGLNRRIVDEALADGRRILVTCDNGIAALEEITYAKEAGMTVIITDHHEVQEKMPDADAILDPKRENETYPFDGLCGAGVAFKLIAALYQQYHIVESEVWKLLPYVAVATVADVMELRGENRILVKEGLAMLPAVENPGLRALIEVQNLLGKNLNAGHIGFILGPCFNAAGRIATVEESFALLMETDMEKARKQAIHLKEINESRKAMTEAGEKEALRVLSVRGDEKSLPPVLVIFLPDIHESLAGIIAGRVKERYHHPAIVFTRTEEGIVKGSGRSIEAYDMFAELMKCKDLMIRFGGHKMAAGMTLREKDLPELERRLCGESALTEEDFCRVIRIDAAMPVGYATEHLLNEFSRMEPFGVGNPKPVFAEQHFRVLRGQRLGKERNVLKLLVENTKGSRCDAMLFRGIDMFEAFVVQEWGEGELRRMYEGRENRLDIAFTYYPELNEFRGKRTIQMHIAGYCHVC